MIQLNTFFTLVILIVTLLSNSFGADIRAAQECSTNADCPNTQTCERSTCVDPCINFCGTNAMCNVINHSPVCTCRANYTGDPFSNCTPITVTCIGEPLLDLLTKWRQGDVLPVPLPPLKVITLPSYEGQYAGYGIKILFSTGEMKLMGVNDLLIDKLTTSTRDGLLDVSGTIQFPLLTVTSDNYNIKGKAYSIYNLKGSGVMRIALDNVLVPFYISLGPQGEGSKVDHLRLDFTIDDVRVNLADSSWPINNILNAQGLYIIASYYNNIVQSAAANLKYTLDQYMINVPTKQLLNTFIGNCTNV